MATLSLSDIQAARERIKDVVEMTPCDYSEILSRLYGCHIYLKLENLQITGSFKPRGAFNKILQLTPEQRTAGVVAASAGNHAQGVAYAARQLGIAATIVMPETTPLAKIRGTEELGAAIVLYGSRYGEAYEKATELQQQHGYTFIHAFDDPQIIAGQGSVGLEVLEQVPDLDMLVVPIGGGGLISGSALAIKATRPEVRIIGVEAGRIPSMKSSIEAGHIETSHPANTIADGISIIKVGQHTFPLVQQYVDEILTVSEENIASAIMMLLEREKTLTEGAGAVGFAALSQGYIDNIKDKKIVVALSGGNIDMTMLTVILERGMEYDGRMARLKVVIPDKPGNIAKLAALVAEQQANILEIYQHHSVSEVDIGETEVEMVLEAKGKKHIDAIIASIIQCGYMIK
jgi:threonine dehydratase